MSIVFSDYSQTIKPSATLAIGQKARQLQQEGIDVISLSVGEPDFPTPEHIKQAAIAAIGADHTHYTNVDGIPELKKAIVAKFQRENGLTYTPEQVMASTGAKQCLINLMSAVLNPGDQVIIPAPYWVSYPEMVNTLGAKPVFITAPLSQSFKITATQLEAAITPKTKLFLLNSPSNPSGMEYTTEELKALAAVLKKYPQLIIACDDIYEHLRWDDKPFTTLLNVAPELAEQTVIINGVSKAYAMTGWRIGYAAGPKGLIKVMTNLQSQSTSNPCSIAQYAAVAALNGGLDCVQSMRDAFKQRNQKMFAALSALPGFECLPVKATMYLFPKVEKAMEKHGIKDDIAFATFLLEKAQVAVVPGTPFGLPGYIRFSVATPEDLLDKAIARLQALL